MSDLSTKFLFNVIVFRFFTKFFSRPPVSQNASVNVTSLGNTYYAITDAAWCEKINSESLEAEEHINLTDLFGMTLSTAHPHFGKAIGKLTLTTVAQAEIYCAKSC